MRLAVCAVSAVLVSGCSWLGGGGHSGYGYQGQSGYAAYGQQASNPCVVYAPSQPIPHGCDPASVTMSTGAHGGFPQQPNFATGGYGSHAGSAGGQHMAYNSGSKLKKPKLRGTFSMGVEKSNAGDFINYDKMPTLNPETAYDPHAFDEGYISSQPVNGEGRLQTDTYSAIVDVIHKPSIAFDDVHSTPLHLQAGLEYIMSPKFTLFANAGYAYSEGNHGNVISIDGDLTKRVQTQDFVAGAAVPAPAGTSDSTTVIPDAGTIAHFAYNFSDMQRFDGEVGGRYYFNPIVRDQKFKTLTPFIGASAGVTRHNAQHLIISQDQAFYKENYDHLAADTLPDSGLAYYSVQTGNPRVEVYDSQLLPHGSLTAGLEWQVTPKTALAFETGVRYEAARDYANGNKGDANIAVPLTLRGSFNF